MVNEKIVRHEGMGVTDEEWDEYSYLFDLIAVEKRNPYLQGYHPLEEAYPLMKLIAKSDIPLTPLRYHLISFLEANENQ